MTFLKESALAVATCVVILLLAIVSDAALEIYTLRRDAQAATHSGGACVDAKGSWTNWSWPNVPTLSPPCPGAEPTPEPADKK